MRQCIPSAAELLLNNYIQLAQEFIDSATPQGDFLQAVAANWRYERALQGIRLLAQHHAGQLVQSLITWRGAVNEDIKKHHSTNSVVNLHGVCKRAAMEVLFLEAAMQVFEEFVPEFWQEQPFQGFFKSMQHVAFRWLLNADEYVPHQELALVRAHVVAVSGRLVGIMSRICLPDISATFVGKLEERVATRKDGAPRADFNVLRSQALKLCAGMRHVVLSFGDDQQLQAATAFLHKAHPLNYTAAVKKSQVHHALCEMLTEVLAPLIRSNQPQASLQGLSAGAVCDWYNAVLKLKNEVGQWVNKHSKHTNVGYPLVTVLVCLVDEANYAKQVESMADFLAKQMRVKEYRLLCFKCLGYLVTSSLVRHRAAGEAQPQVLPWLDRVIRPVLASARKGGIPVQEQQDFVAQIADLCPEHCVGSVIPELLGSEAPEAQLIGLRALYAVCTSVPHDCAAAQDLPASSQRRRSTPLAGAGSGSTSSSNTWGGGARGGSGSTRRLVHLPPRVVLDLIRSGQHPLELQGVAHVLPRVQQQLAVLLAAHHRAFGSLLSINGDAVAPKDKAAQLGLFSWVIKLLPYLRPEQWVVLRPLDYLPSYTTHVDGSVRACSCEALLAIVCGCPSLRGAVLSAMVTFAAAVPDDAVQAVRECLLLLRSFIDLWRSLLHEQCLQGSTLSSRERDTQPLQPAAAATSSRGAAADESGAQQQQLDSAGQPALNPASLCMDLHRLEGALLLLLCSHDASIRCDAFRLLGLLRTLHQQLCLAVEQWGLQPGAVVQQQQQQQPLQQHLQLAQQQGAASPHPAGVSLSASFSSVHEGSRGLAGGPEGGAAPTLFARHRPSPSRDSFEPPLSTPVPAAPLALPDPSVMCLMDVLDEVGADTARSTYWDFGDWSDLWRATKHVPRKVNLQSVMAANDDVGQLRWMRCLLELAQEACRMCPASMGVALLEMLHKLSRYLPHDAAGRLIIPPDSPDGRRSEAWRALVVVCCACPPSLRDHTDEAAAHKAPVSINGRELIRALLASLTSASAVPQQVCLMALGHCNPEHYQALCGELPAIIDEYQRPKQRRGTAARPDEARKGVANVLRLLAAAMPPRTLSAHASLRARYLDWMRDTALFLQQLPRFGEAFWDAFQVAYCLCAVCCSVAGELSAPLTLPMAMLRDTSPVAQPTGGQGSTRSSASQPPTPAASTAAGAQQAAFLHQAVAAAAGGVGGPKVPAVGAAGAGAAVDSSLGEVPSLAAGSVGIASGPASGGSGPMARKQLFEMLAGWCEEGISEEDYHARLQASISAALSTVREGDVEMREGLVQELGQAADCLDQVARLAMAALLQGPAFDTDARRAQGPVLRWVDRLLRAPAPPCGASAGLLPAAPKAAVGRAALLNLLRSNLEVFGVCVDRCYDRDPRIGRASFQVVSEVYALNPVAVEPHVVLSLVLFKMVDASPEVREDALHMLHTLSMREWQQHGGGGGGGGAAAGGARGNGLGELHQHHSQQQPQGHLDAGEAADALLALEQDAAAGGGAVLVLGALQDSYQQFQYQLAVKLARERPELSEALCEEMMTRQLELADKVAQHPVLTCLGPWMENLTIATHWKGTWCERLLKSMYYVTLRHGDELPLEIERLWSTLAMHRRNIIPMLDFLATLGTHVAYQQELSAMLEYLGVAKRICLYLARVSPQQTIDHLVYEVSLQLLEEEAPGGSGHTGSSGSGSAAGGPGGAAAAGAGAGAAAGGCGALEFAAALRADAAGGHDGGEAAAAAAAAGGAQQALAAAAGEPGGAASTPSSESAFRASFGSLAAAGAASSSTLPASAFSAAGYPSLSGTATPGLSITGAAGAAASCAEQQQQQQQQALGQRGLRASANSLGLSRGSSGAYGDLRDSGHVPSSSVCNTPSGAQAAAAGIGSSLRRSFTDQSDVGSSISSVSGVAGMPGGGPSASAVEPQAAAAAAGGGLALAAAGATGLGREGSTASSLGSILLGAAGGGQSASAAPGGVLGSITEREWVAGGGSAGAAAAARGGDAGGGGGSGMAGFNAALLCAHDLDLSVYYAAQPHSGSATSQHGGRQAGAGAGGAGGVPQREDGGMSWLAGAGGVMMIPHSSPRQTRDREAATPALRGLVTRSELALCLLTEVAYEHDEDISSHLPLLCHTCLLLADHEEHLVAAAAQQLLINCIYSLSAHALDAAQEERAQQPDCRQATQLIRYLQAAKGRRLWAYEDVAMGGGPLLLPSAAALAGIVAHCLRALDFEPGLQPAWVGVALEWALHARSRHLACRSQQVLRALQPQLSGDMCSTLLSCLQQCLAAADGSPVARDVALELLLTLRHLVDALPARKLILFPQVFWASMSLLLSSYVAVHHQGLLMLATCLQRLNMQDSMTLNVLLATAPAADEHALQQLLLPHAHAQHAGGHDAGSRAWLASPDSSGARYATAPTPQGSRCGAVGGGGGGGVGCSSDRDQGGSSGWGGGLQPGSRLDVGPSPGARPLTALHADVAASFVGGANGCGRPMLWPFAQLLPWPGRGPDGPAHHMLAVQQLLFKGLLFEQTQLAALRLFSLLAGGLCQLPAATPGTPLQAALDHADAPASSSNGRSSRDQGGSASTPEGSSSMSGGGAGGSSSVRASQSGLRQSTPGETAGGGERSSSSGGGGGGGSGTASAGSSRSGSAAASSHSGRHGDSRDSSAAGAAALADAAALRASARGGAPSAAAESAAPRTRTGRMWQSAQHGAGGVPAPADQQQHARRQQQQRGEDTRLQEVDDDPAALSRSAPALGGIASSSTPSSSGTAAGLARSTTRADAAAGRVCSPHAAPWSTLGGQAATCGAAGVLGGSGSSGSSCRKLPGTRAEFQCVLGQRHGQLLVSIACVVPFFCSQLGQLEPASELLAELQRCMAALAGACCTHGLRGLGSKLHALARGLHHECSSSSSSSGGGMRADGRPGSGSQPAAPAGCARGNGSPLRRLLEALCLQLSRTLLPTYADWLLRCWMGVLLLPGACQLHAPVLLLLRCLFEEPGLQLGPAAALLLDTAFLGPLVALSQGPLCQQALAALDAIITFAAASPEVQQLQAQHAALGASAGSSSSSSMHGAQQPPTPVAAAAVAAGAGGAAAATSCVDLQGLAACLLPQLDTVELLHRVLHSLGPPQQPRKRRPHVLPFLGDAAGQGAGEA